MPTAHASSADLHCCMAASCYMGAVLSYIPVTPLALHDSPCQTARKTDHTAKPWKRCRHKGANPLMHSTYLCALGVQIMGPSWNATKQALNVAQLRISSLCSAKQQSDAQHDQQIQVATALLLTTHAPALILQLHQCYIDTLCLSLVKTVLTKLPTQQPSHYSMLTALSIHTCAPHYAPCSMLVVHVPASRRQA